jgi:hypothetical protein
MVVVTDVYPGEEAVNKRLTEPGKDDDSIMPVINPVVELRISPNGKSGEPEANA